MFSIKNNGKRLTIELGMFPDSYEFIVCEDSYISDILPAIFSKIDLYAYKYNFNSVHAKKRVVEEINRLKGGTSWQEQVKEILP